MEKMFTTGNTTLGYTEMGMGNSVVLLHGYLEAKEMWSDLALDLSKSYRVICPDLPGHGKSTFEGLEVSMEYAAATIAKLLDFLGIEHCVLVGHSMGGYVALAFAELFPEKLKGLVLFHSHPFADSDEKRKNRQFEIEQVAAGYFESMINTNIPRLFANYNLERLRAWVESWKTMALATPETGVMAALCGMAGRRDRNSILSELQIPVLMIFGRNDNLISNDVASSLEGQHSQIQTLWLERSGHLGLVEEPDYTKFAMGSFLLAVFSRA
jgi:pimeloyl-ACP methyl ester carboxylesterase